MRSDLEERLRRLEQDVQALHVDTAPAVRRGILRYATTMATLFEVGPDFGNEPLPVTVSGGVSGPASGCSTAFSGATVTFTEHATGATLAVFTTDGSGNYSGVVPLPSSPLSVDVTSAPTGTFAARFATSVSTTVTLTTGVSASVSLFIPTATGYVCNGLCSYPVKTTLNYADSGGGSGGMTYNSGTFRYSGTTSVNYGGGGTCAAQTNVVVTYVFDTVTRKMTMTYNAFVNDCPQAGSVGPDVTLTGVTMTVSCGPFSATGTYPAGGTDKWYNGAAATYSLSEP
jgi:hypothetical protein